MTFFINRIVKGFPRKLPQRVHDPGGVWVKQLVALAVVFYAIVLLRNAWLCDDAYITLRTVDNFVNGYGLVWNIAERVQSYTHPLWMFLLSALYFVTREAYYTTIVLASALSVFAVWVLANRLAAARWSAVIAVLLLTVSKSFVDFSTSGLANPLSYVIMAVFFTIYFRYELTAKTVFWLSLSASLAVLTRADNLLLLIPPLVFALWKVRSWRAIVALLAGMAPLFVWEIFSLFYYGFPVPNTAYAKLNTGINPRALIRQGLEYLLDTATMSPITAVTVALAILTSIVTRSAKYIATGLGLSLYLMYIVKVGGDFMTGRFLATPMFVAVLMLSTFELSRHRPFRLAFGAALVLAAAFWPLNPILSGSDMGEGDERLYWNKGIGDERAAIFQYTGLINGPNSIDDHPWAMEGKAVRNTGLKLVEQAGIGIFGYYAGPEVHVLDKHALADPLLARLPVWTPRRWRPGHFTRLIPEGYRETLLSGDNLIFDPDLRTYYDRLSLITRGSFFGWERTKEIIKMNLRRYEHLIDAYTSRPMITLSYDRVRNPLPQGTSSLHQMCHVLPLSGLRIEFESVRHEDHLDIGVDHNDDYLLEYYLDSRPVASQIIKAQWIETHGIRRDIVETARPAVEQGFNSVVITGREGDGLYSVSHLRFLNLLPEDRIGELLRSRFAVWIDLKDLGNLAPTGWDYTDSVTLAAMYAIPDRDSIQILLAYRVNEDMSGNYKIFLHLTPLDGEKFGNFDFLPSPRTHMWKKGSIETFSRMVPNPGKPFRIATGLFDLKGRLGTAFGVDYEPRKSGN